MLQVPITTTLPLTHLFKYNILDLQCHVRRWHLPVHDRSGRHSHTRCLPRRVRKGARYVLSPLATPAASERHQTTPLGTSLICSFLEIFMSFVSPRTLQRIFPPMVTGTVILMIGASLIGSSGIPNWGGGSNDCMSRPASGFFQLCPDITAPRPLP